MNLPAFKKPSLLQSLVIFHGLILLLAVFFLARHKGEPAPDREKIVVIPIEGVISLKDGSLKRGHSVPEIVKRLKRIRKRDDVKAVVLRINSPGGSVGAVQEIYRALRKVREKGKFIVSSFGDVSASGGYYIACAGDKIVSNPGSLTGSIGVVMQLPIVQGLLRKVGVSMEVIKSGDMKDAGSPFRKMSATERKHFRTVILDAYDQFFQAVKEGRKIEESTLKSLADGRIFSGRMAFQNKLVDQLGGLEEAIEEAKKLAGLKGKKPEIIYPKDKPSLERLLRMFSKTPLEDLASMSDNQIRLMYVLQ